jgi:hypothetical protein
MAIDEPRARSPKWRNVLSWTAASSVALFVYMLVTAAFLQKGPVGPLANAGAGIAIVLGSVLLGSAVVGLSHRNVPFNRRNFIAFVLLSGLTIVVFLSFRALLADTVSLEAIGVSAWVALLFGLVLTAVALIGLLTTAAVHARLPLVQPGHAELLVEQGRVLPYSLVVIGAMGLTLVLLSLAAPGGPLAPGVALAGVAVLIAVQAGLTLAIWPRIDELSQTLSRETGNAAYYLIVMLGGGWAILALLDLVPAPPPLEGLTLLTAILLAASLIAAGRRGLLRAE